MSNIEPEDKDVEEKDYKDMNYKYLITYVAVNNDTYDENVFTLLFEELPDNLTKVVKDTYNTNGVWVPDVHSIRLFNLEEWAKVNMPRIDG